MNRRRFLSLLGATALVPVVAKVAPAIERTFAGRTVATYRSIPILLQDSLPEIEGMVPTLCQTLFYGDTARPPMQFMGIAQRFPAYAQHFAKRVAEMSDDEKDAVIYGSPERARLFHDAD